MKKLIGNWGMWIIVACVLSIGAAVYMFGLASGLLPESVDHLIGGIVPLLACVGVLCWLIGMIIKIWKEVN